MENTNKGQQLFYTHSNRLHKFLCLFGFEYTKYGRRKSDNKEYWGFIIPNDDSLDYALAKWSEMKEKFPLEKVIKKKTGQ